MAKIFEKTFTVSEADSALTDEETEKLATVITNHLNFNVYDMEAWVREAGIGVSRVFINVD